MSFQLILTIMTVVASLVVAFTSFCRLTKMSKSTAKRSARVVFWMLSSSAWVVAFGVLVYGWRPDVGHAFAFGILALMQVMSRKNWRGGVPTIYQNTIIGASSDHC